LKESLQIASFLSYRVMMGGRMLSMVSRTNSSALGLCRVLDDAIGIPASSWREPNDTFTKSPQTRRCVKCTGQRIPPALAASKSIIPIHTRFHYEAKEVSSLLSFSRT